MAWFGGRLMRVVGDSMAPTLRGGELVFVDVRAFQKRPPQRHEIVAVRPKALGGRAVVKRLIGLPQEQLDVGSIQWRLAEDQFFLMGDGVDRSADSRSFGPVSQDELLGVVTRSIWPWRSLRAPLKMTLGALARPPRR